MNVRIAAPQHVINGSIRLEGSKSISNRLLLMRALCSTPFEIENLSPSDDTTTLQLLLNNNTAVCDVGAAGTTMRFLTAYFSITPGERILTGSERMKKRPIKILVDALRELGADIEYMEAEGYPPLKIKGSLPEGGRIRVKADVSSQYISALLMIGPVLKNGLVLELEGKIASYPYIDMTLRTMQQLGIPYAESGNIFTVSHGAYQPMKMIAESDWSAASYYYSVCALQPGSKIIIYGLQQKSLQGDSVLPAIYDRLGVKSNFIGDVLHLENTGRHTSLFENDFSDCPDLAQTVVVTCAALGIAMDIWGVESLRIKETDRTMALQTELIKFGVSFIQENEHWKLSGKTTANQLITISTYDDHRMAMCFAPLALLHPLEIEDATVVKKSYPSFWSDFSSIGFSIEFS